MWVPFEYGQQVSCPEGSGSIVSIDYPTGLVEILLREVVSTGYKSQEYVTKKHTCHCNNLKLIYSFWHDPFYKGPEFRDGKYALRKDGKIFQVLYSPTKTSTVMKVTDGISEEWVMCKDFLSKTFKTKVDAENYWK